MRTLKFGLLSLVLLALFSPAANAGILMETGDGLPIEVELVRAYRDEVTVQIVVSKREMKFNLQKLPKATKEALEAFIKAKRESVKTVNLRVVLEDNPSTRVVALKQNGFLDINDEAAAATGSIMKNLPAKERLLRIEAAVDDIGVDFPVEAYVYWIVQMTGQSTPSAMPAEQNLKFNLTPVRGEYLTRPGSMAARSAYRGFAVLLVNPANGLIVGKRASESAYLTMAEEKFRMR